MSEAQHRANDTGSMTSLWKYSTPLKTSLIPFSTLVSGNCSRFNDCCRKKGPIVLKVMHYDGHWPPRHAYGDLPGVYYSACAQRCVSVNAMKLLTFISHSLDSACPIIKAEPYILLIYSRRDIHLHFT